jgi:glycine/D-amino acid oxidase-like deaminating enzyme
MALPTARRPAATLNRDYERRPYWHATMPPVPSFRDRPLPDRADVVIVGGGYLGINAARELARAGAAVTLLEAEHLGFGGSTRNGGIVHPGYKWGRSALIHKYGEDTGRALWDETMAGYETIKRVIADEAIDCEFRESGYLDLAWAPAHARELQESVAGYRELGIAAEYVEKADLADEIGSTFYHGGLVFPPSGLLHPGKYFAGLARAAAAAGADLHEGARATAIRRQGDGRLVVETSRGAILTKDVVVGTNGYTDGAVPALRRRVIPIGSYIIATEPLPDELARVLSPRGRAFFDTKNFLYYWHVSEDRRMIFGGRASFLPMGMDRIHGILHKGMLEVHPQLAGYRIEYGWGGNVGFTFDRMPHVGRQDGLTFGLGCCGTGVALMTSLGIEIARWLGGGPEPALARLGFPLVPAPYEGRPWFLPVVGEWFRLQDALARRGIPG